VTPATRRHLHTAVAVAGFLPAVVLAGAFFRDRLGANPVEELTHETGEWALRLLLASLSVTPLRRAFGWSVLAPYRRTLGLLAFFYASLHLAIYASLDLGFDVEALTEDLVERTYITVGFSAYCMLFALAVTSARKAQRRLGRRWVQLHRLAYAAGVFAVIHFLWLVKADRREPLLYGAFLVGLLGVRAWWAQRGRLRAAVPAPARTWTRRVP
jgi:sulfoxide reductase heme-binding subunit YedZ